MVSVFRGSFTVVDYIIRKKKVTVECVYTCEKCLCFNVCIYFCLISIHVCDYSSATQSLIIQV